MDVNNMSIEQHLQQIANMLVLNGTLTDSSGLIHGKTGIAVFFFHYARYADNELFADYALELISEMQTQIHANSPANYETGIAGIGVGIDYLIRNNYLNADKDIFNDFDQRMVRAVMYDPWQNFSLYDGLTGYGRYWMMRLPSVQARKCLIRIIELIEEKLMDISDKEQTEIYCFLHDLCHIQNFDVETRHVTSLLEQCRMGWKTY